MRDFWLFLHLIGVVTWVGGMSFGHHCLRPAVLALPPPQRLALMADVLGRFFGHVTASLVLIWVSGIALMLQAGLARVPAGWHAMAGIALLMTLIFGVIRLARFPRLRAAVASADWAGAAAALDGIRMLVAGNLGLGLLTVAVATLGRLA